MQKELLASCKKRKTLYNLSWFMKKTGYADVVVGLQFGDEGKARVIDMLAKQYDVVARFNGGSNAGHTIKNSKGSIALQQIPSGIFYPNIDLYIGSGCVVNIVKLVGEIKIVAGLGINLKKRLHISSQASVIQPHHMIIDGIIGKAVGTTKNGIGPAYSDKATRMDGDRLVNIRLADMLDKPEIYLQKIKANLLATLKLYKIKNEDAEKQMQDLERALKIIAPYIEIDPLYLQKRVENGTNVLFEGAQSIMLDVSRGSVPYVTSSNTIAAAAYTGGDVSPKHHRKTIGIAKAVMSRVGHGPFPSELGGKKSEDYGMAEKNGKPMYTRQIENTYDLEKLLSSGNEFDLGIAMRIISAEYGTVTSRPRRIGMFDLIQLSYAARMNGVDELMINKCDVLQAYSKSKKGKIPLVNGYVLDKKSIDYVPASPQACYRVAPKVSWIDGFSEDISAIRKFDDLPKSLKAFIAIVEKATKTKVAGIGVGSDRSQFISR